MTHKKHIYIMMAVAAGLVVAGAAGFYCYQKYFSPEAQRYREEIVLSKGHLFPANDKNGPDSARVPILIYHHIGPLHPTAAANVKSFSMSADMLEKQLEYLKTNGYTTISFEQLNNHLSYNAPLPKKPVILSFDDAWENQYLYALPLLQKYNFTATFFVPTKNIGHNHILSWDEIIKLDKAGMQIGSHSETHPFLNKITAEEAIKEITESKKIIESKLGKPVYDFAYPYGQYNDNVINIVRNAGYRTARTTDVGIYQKRSIILNLKGMLVFDNFDGFLSKLGDK